ncbi:FAD-dependent oxidoreductase [Variovorax ureilyticus]|uniref:FAD-dependent oxidoreductase n=1 Tax=Variovorax ureilyticus TaxID=1836198 RepID=A0ABU8VKA3_9BURK
MPDDADPHDATPRSSATLACDLLVVGSGAGGLAAAVTAAHLGLSVIVVEKESQLGGTTAWSGGWMWIPRNPLARAAGIEEDMARPLAYLRHELGAQFDEARARAFLENGPRMVDFFQRRTALRFIDGNAIPDFHGHTPDASTGGRSVCAAPFDARRLGKHIHQIKPPLPETTLWGMGIASGRELRHFLDARTSPRSAWYVAKRLAAYARDRLLHGRGLRLVNGNALTGALAASAFEAGVQVLVDHAARRLLRHGERVVGAVVESPAGRVRIEASRGVVLACGGFPHDTERLKAMLPHAPTGREHWSAAPRGNTGDGLRLGESVGGHVAGDLAQAAALAPVSLVPRADGSLGHFPHLIERAKPGLIAVRRDGRRFVNEADSYHDFMRGLLAATPSGEPVEAWLVCDSRFIRRFGLGAVKPAPIPHRRMLASGYLKRGRTLAELAAACGIDAAGLVGTIERYNAQARQGCDEDFSKGGTPYNRVQGEARPGLANPCMAPIERGPFHAVKVVAGSLGTFAGLRVDASAHVLDRHGAPIAGLYAAGNDMASVMGGHYPSGGITLGPALTFAWIAAHDAAGAASPSADRRESAPASSPTLSTPEPLFEEPVACTTR